MKRVMLGKQLVRVATLAVVWSVVMGLSGSFLAGAYAGAVRTNLTGFTANTLPANDDDSTGLVLIGFQANFFGLTFSNLFVNNNGNVTITNVLSQYTPFPLTSNSIPIIAPFFADVDTEGLASGVVTYGNDTVDGHLAFGVNWIHVGYYNENTDKLNSFQLVIIDRSDVAAGDFDFELNYDQIQWETGDASSGTGGLGGSSARAGFASGSSQPGTFFELTGSAVNGALLDSNPTTGLIYHSLNSTQPGRYVFQVRSGTVIGVGECTLASIIAQIQQTDLKPSAKRALINGVTALHRLAVAIKCHTAIHMEKAITKRMRKSLRLGRVDINTIEDLTTCINQFIGDCSR